EAVVRDAIRVPVAAAPRGLVATTFARSGAPVVRDGWAAHSTTRRLAGHRESARSARCRVVGPTGRSQRVSYPARFQSMTATAECQARGLHGCAALMLEEMDSARVQRRNAGRSIRR